MRWRIVAAGMALLLSLPALDAQAILVGHWTFDTDFSDSSGNNLNGTASSAGAAAGFVDSGRTTGVLSLDGTAHVQVADNELLDLPNTFTIAAWINPTTLPVGTGSAAHIVRKINEVTGGPSGSNEVYYLRLSGTSTAPGTNLDFLTRDSTNAIVGRVQYNPTPPTNVWTFVAATYDGPNGVSSMYITDTNVPVGTDVASTAPRVTGGALRIGRGPNTGGPFTGLIDDVWVFNHVLSSTELAGVKAGTYVASQPGDHNFDGKVDAADYVVWRKTNINAQQGYDDWRANFGKPAGSGLSAGSSVPEPGAALYIVGSCLSILGLRRRSCRR